jgi:prepilin-type N-terminal cleavage/methylation domain-containing protein
MHDKSMSSRPARGFTLIELLVVISIIAILLGLLFPALAAVRNSARLASARTLMNTVGNAITSFKTTNRRDPGVFSPDWLADGKNYGGGAGGEGLTFMDSALIDLAGGAVSEDFDGQNGVFKEPLDINNPTAGSIFIAPALIGSSENKDTFLSLPEDVLRPIEGQKISGFVPVNSEQEAGLANGDPQRLMPDVIDPWGMPILLWQVDKRATVNDDFASAGSGQNPAQIYWRGNGSILGSDKIGLGSKRVNIANSSFLGEANGADNRERSLEGMLGHPDFPTPNETTKPQRALSNNILHCAGPDRIYAEGVRDTDAVGYGPLGGSEVDRDASNDITIGVGG